MRRGNVTTFVDRRDAGRRLGERLAREPPPAPVVVLGLPRGGVPVAAEVAAALGGELDVFLVRKLGAPFNPELAVGAVASGGVTVYNEDLLRMLGLDAADLEPIRRRELAELERRERVYRGGRPPPALEGRAVVLVDDGIATGATMEAAARAVRALHPAEVIVAVPTAATDAVERLERVADRVVALSTPEPYISVGSWYESFPQLSDEDVIAALANAGGQDPG
ncbi:MAG TPA: phosphoribosyltransferase family protein [Gammaproteobacteria bacterium]|nr:phosphoribosyltransferase family protein [Gammaproteobacteria bacterium]